MDEALDKLIPGLKTDFNANNVVKQEIQTNVNEQELCSLCSDKFTGDDNTTINPGRTIVITDCNHM
jgi:hypothetical protein